MESTDLHTDGNAIAGMLQQIFAVEFTAMERTCQSCGDRSAAGAHRTYAGAGLVLRCPQCGDVALRITSRADHAVFELRGAWTSRIDQ